MISNSGAFTARRYITPNLFVNLLISKHQTSIYHQQQKQFLFFCGQMDLFPIAVYFPAVWIYFKSGQRPFRFILHFIFLKFRMFFQHFHYFIKSRTFITRKLHNNQSPYIITFYMLKYFGGSKEISLYSFVKFLIFQHPHLFDESFCHRKCNTK